MLDFIASVAKMNRKKEAHKIPSSESVSD